MCIRTAGDHRGCYKDAGLAHLGHLDPLWHRERDTGCHYDKMLCSMKPASLMHNEMAP